MEDARSTLRPEEDLLEPALADKIFVIYPASSAAATPSIPPPPIDTPLLPSLYPSSTSTTSKRIVAAQSSIVTYKAGLEDGTSCFMWKIFPQNIFFCGNIFLSIFSILPSTPLHSTYLLGIMVQIQFFTYTLLQSKLILMVLFDTAYTYK